jgi:CHAT domain-containing protein
VQESLHVLEGVRAHLVPNDFMKRGYGETAQRAYRDCIRLLEHTGQPGSALEVAEDARARAFLDLLATRDLQVKKAHQAQLASLRSGAGPVDKMTSAPGSTAVLMRGGSSGAALSSDSADPDLRSLVAVPPFSVPEVQATARRLNSTVLSYWVGDDATYIWVIPAEGAIHTAAVEVPQKRLEELIESVGPRAATGREEEDKAGRGSRALGKPPRKTEQVGARGGAILTVATCHQKNWRELYSLLIEPVEAWLPSTSGSLLTIEPHGPLLMLPFAALTDKQDRYLLERFSLHYTPAVSLLQFTKKKQQEVEHIPPHYLLVADPSGMPRGPDESTLPGLPGSRHEVATVARLLPGSEVTLLQGSQAAEDQVVTAASQSTVIHFATHGIIRDEQPFESFLALGGSRTDKKLDGRLTAQKIYSLDLHADLVFLSACRSGAGKVTGDGLVGLTRAFWYAGAPSVIASLWDVADEPIYRLVANFYRSRLQGNDKSRALRSAQLRLLHELRAGHVTVHTGTAQVALPEDPVFWASFVLQGEP